MKTIDIINKQADAYEATIAAAVESSCKRCRERVRRVVEAVLAAHAREEASK